MKNTQILDYIKEIIEDEYAMSVLYFSMRDTIEKNDYASKGLQSIKISNKFINEFVKIHLNGRIADRSDALALLLSVRALMLDQKLIDFCSGNNLIFEQRPAQKYYWAKYLDIIKKFENDDDFNSIFSLLVSSISGNKLTNEEMQYFHSHTKAPEYRNLINYYKEQAKQKNNNFKEIIPNNAYVCDEIISEFVVPACVEYVGNTAFAYCPNLTQLVFQKDKTLFGKFPIIECVNLKHIMVPDGSEEYYQQALPYYKDIIFSDSSLKTYEEKLTQLPKEEKTVIADEAEHPKNENNPNPIEPKKLKSVFGKETSANKYLWYLSILMLIKEKRELVLSYRDISVRMATIAWPLVFTDHLELGTIDKINECLTNLQRKVKLIPQASPSIVEFTLKDYYDKKSLGKYLAIFLKNIPYEFLSPWIKFVSDKDIIDNTNKSSYNGPYAFHDDNIIMDEDWYDYILENYDELYRFAKNSFVDYLKLHNNALSLIRFISNN